MCWTVFIINDRFLGETGEQPEKQRWVMDVRPVKSNLTFMNDNPNNG